MPPLKELVADVHDQDTLSKLLSQGLGWPVDPEFAFEEIPEIAKEVKADGKVRVHRLIPASVEDATLVVLAEFERKYVRRDLRELLASLRRFMRASGKFDGTTGYGDVIFIVATPGYEDLRFVLFEEQDRRLPRIRSFGWRKEFIGRTVLTHNLEGLKWTEDSVLRAAAWERAWDVEALTEQFYKDYEQVFAAVLAQVQGAPDDKTRHSWTQLLFNRLLFIAFIQRMGWMQVPGGSRDGYLFDLYRAPRGPYRTFMGMLQAVFDELDTQEDYPYKNKNASTLGNIPYLNGGLFDKDDPLNRPDFKLPDEAFAHILAEPGGLFARYNFTVTESTPLDQEVAVDPEMLGKIFERLIIAEERHRSGTYYTPRPIVEFMVNEALKGYLTERGIAKEKAAMLVDEDWVESEELSFKPSELQDALDALFEVRAVDPACGSGAYLLMLLQRLFELVDRLEVSRDKRRNPSQKHLYETKLRLLQRCVYGVDINETAVRIARLRLWLSLVVENRGEKPEPLPNFDFLIMQGDSLASPLSSQGQGQLGFPHKDVREYTAMKAAYFHPDKERPRPTRGAMAAKRQEIATVFDDHLANSTLRSLSINPFDWDIDFAEVFDPEAQAEKQRPPGFDIVVMNPPYVTANRLDGSDSEVFNAYMRAARTDYGFSSDLYVHFMYRALALLCDGGTLAAITPTTFYTNTTKQFLRAELLKWRLRWLVPLAPSVFQAVVYSGITLVQKSPARQDDECGYLDFRLHSPDHISQLAHEQESQNKIGLVEYRRAYASMFFKPTPDNRWLFEKLLPAHGPVVVEGRRFAPLEVVAPALDTGIDSGNCRAKLFYLEPPPGARLPKMLQGVQVVRYGSWWENPSARFRYADVGYVADESRKGVGRGGVPPPAGSIGASGAPWRTTTCGSGF